MTVSELALAIVSGEAFTDEDAIRVAEALLLMTDRVVAHHNIAHLSSDAVAESIGGDCQICARALAGRR